MRLPSYPPPPADLSVLEMVCGKGTYVRYRLARDLAARLWR